MNRLGFLRKLLVVPAIPFLSPKSLERAVEAPAKRMVESPHMPNMWSPTTITFSSAGEDYAEVYQSEDDTFVIRNKKSGNWVEV